MAAPLRFVDARIEWLGRSRGVLTAIDDQGGEWPFQLGASPKPTGLGMGWKPLYDPVTGRSVRDDIRALQADQGGRTGMMAVLGPKLREAFRQFMAANPDVDVFSMQGDGKREAFYRSWADLAPSGFVAEEIPAGIRFVRRTRTSR